MIHPLRFRPLAALLGLAIGTPCALLPAQSVPPPTDPDEDATIELSPFVITEDSTAGYVSENSLAGSRLNTNLRDTPAVVDVFTAEFLQDIAADTLEDALAYANNSQIDYGDSERVINGLSQVDTSSVIRFRTRGVPVSAGRNYFETGVQQDLFSIERIDESRGPNSILFGIGSAGGLVNSSTKRPRLNAGSASFAPTIKVGDDGLYRATFDVNVPVVPKRAGLRLNLLDHDQESWRDYVYNSKRAGQASVMVKPFEKSTVNFEYESGVNRGTISRNWTARDRVSMWLANDSPLTAATTAAAPTTAQAAQGLSRLTNATRTVYVDNQGYVYNALNEWASTGLNQGGNGTFFNDPALMPYESNIAGPGGRTHRAYNVYDGSWQQQITRDLFVEVAGYHEDGDIENYDIGFSDVFLQADPNRYFRNPSQIHALDGYTLPTEGSNTVNPNAGQAYIEGSWQRRQRFVDRDALRASLAWNVKAGWFGDHQLAAMAQRSWDHTQSNTAREAWLGAPFASGPTGTSNLLWRRHYVTWGDSGSFMASDWADLPTVTYVHPTKGTLTSAWVPTGAGVDTKQTIDSLQFAAQSYFWKRRIATTLGYRMDDLTQSRVEGTTDKTGVWANSNGVPVLDYDNVSTFTFSGNTRTAGAVFHATHWLSFFANGSENLGLPNFSQKLGVASALPPPPEGSGRDYGVTLTLLDGKAFARIARFEVTDENRADAMGVNNFFTPNYNELMASLTGLYTPAQLAAYSELAPTSDANADLINYEAEGYEARINANITNNLRLVANVSITESSKNSAYPYTRRMLEQLGQFISDVQAANPGTDLDALVGAQYRTLVTEMESRSIDFEQDFGNRKYKGSLFANYRFSDGVLKGLGASFGARYQGRIAAGTDTATGTKYWGNSYVQYDAALSYRTKLRLLGDAAQELNLQLNVKNLFDNDDLLILRYADGTTVERFTFQDPRQISLTVSMKF